MPKTPRLRAAGTTVLTLAGAGQPRLLQPLSATFRRPVGDKNGHATAWGGVVREATEPFNTAKAGARCRLALSTAPGAERVVPFETAAQMSRCPSGFPPPPLAPPQGFGTWETHW